MPDSRQYSTLLEDEEASAKLNFVDRIFRRKVIAILTRVLSMVLRLADVASDVRTAIRFAIRGHESWAGLCAFITLVSPTFQYCYIKRKGGTSLPYLMPFGIYHMYKEFIMLRFLWRLPQRSIFNGLHLLCGGGLNEVLAGIECLCESLPQACTQLCAYYRIGGDWWNLVSLAISLIGVLKGAWTAIHRIWKGGGTSALAGASGLYGGNFAMYGTEDKINGNVLLLDKTPLNTGAVMAVSWLVHADSEVRVLSMMQCGLDPSSADAIAWAISKMTNMEELLMIGNGDIGDSGGTAIIKPMYKNTSVKKLFLGGCNLGTEAGQALGAMLEENRALEQLGIGGNANIGEIGFCRIFRALQTNTCLKKLAIARCDLCSAWCSELAEMLMKNSSLEWLDLGGNRNIGDQGGLSIIVSLKKHSSMKKLYIGDCGLGSECAQALGELLIENNFLEELLLHDNINLGEGGLLSIIDAAKMTSSLRKLDIARCNLSTFDADIHLKSNLQLEDIQ